MKGIVIQYACSVFFNLICGMNGFSNVWPSYAIKMLQSEESPLGFKISQSEANLVGSLPMLGALISTIVASNIAEGIGRKKTMILSGLLYTVAWSLLVSARSIIQILCARFLMGIAGGISCVLALVYSSEITELSIRGSTACLSGLLYNCGVMASYLEGWFCSYEVICYMNLTFLVVYVLLMSFLKDSPSYLLKIGKETEALKSLVFYRGKPENSAEIIEELAYMKQCIYYKNTDSLNVMFSWYSQTRYVDVETMRIRNNDEKPARMYSSSNYNTERGALSEKEKLQNVENEKNMENTETKNGWVLLFTVPHNRRAITNSLTFVILVGSMGMVAVQTYASKFFEKAAPGLSPNLCSVIFSLILVLSCLLTVLVTDLVPRRTLMISSSFLTTVCLGTLGCSMRWPSTPTWVALVAVLLFCLAFHLGVINIVFVQLSECYGPKVNGPAAVLVFGAMFLSNFFVLLLFVPAVEYIGIDNAFFVFTAIAGFATVLAYFWIKETRRVPLEEIQRMYESGITYKRIVK